MTMNLRRKLVRICKVIYICNTTRLECKTFGKVKIHELNISFVMSCFTHAEEGHLVHVYA